MWNGVPKPKTQWSHSYAALRVLERAKLVMCNFAEFEARQGIFDIGTAKEGAHS